jgi:hypothetical protein
MAFERRTGALFDMLFGAKSIVALFVRGPTCDVLSSFGAIAVVGASLEWVGEPR